MVKAQLLIRLGPFELSTRHNYISWGRWGAWVRPLNNFRAYPYRAALTVTRFGPGSRTWEWFKRRAEEGGGDE